MSTFRNIFCAFLLFLTCKSSPKKPIHVNFNGHEWLFPSIVGDAVKRYRLSYKPPGYYYAELKNGSIMNLSYTHQPGDFYNEHQPENILYGREINGYIHTFPFRTGLIDSLHHVLEAQFKKKMIMSEDTQRFGLSKLPTNFQTTLANRGHVSYGLIRADSSLHVGLRRKPTFSEKSQQFIEVLFLYNWSEERIKMRMKAF